MGTTGAMFAPGSADVLGYAPDPFNPGEMLPSWGKILWKATLWMPMQGVGLLGDLAYAATPFTGGLLAAPAVGLKSARVASIAGKTHPKRIPSRLPLKTVQGQETISTDFGNPFTENLNIGLAEMQSFAPDILEHDMGLIKAYPNMTETQAALPTDQATEAFIEHAKDNLLYIFDSIPQATRDRSKLWYVGARRIADDFGDQFGVDEASAAGVLAALSPQKDWYMNVSLGRRVMDIMKNKQDFASDDMWDSIPPSLQTETWLPIVDGIKGKKLSEMETATEKAIWLRIYDEKYNDRAYNVISPEGDIMEVVTSASGAPSKAAWGSIPEISKAVQAFESGGDMNVLIPLMGNKHKVRSFYNNILDPDGVQGDVTIDTHAVAAALLRPLSGGSTEVHHNFGSSPMKAKRKDDWLGAMKNQKGSGIQGAYPIYAEAYRRAAAERDVLPREMQSITWEAARGLFTDKFKQSGKNVAAVDAIWKKYRSGDLTLDEARNAVIDTAGESIPPLGKSDDLINTMRKYNIPLTRKNYLEIAYFGNPPAELTAEQELELPEEFRS